jgi:hypothetical protein
MVMSRLKRRNAMPMHLVEFAGVEGYKTRENAVKRGEEIAATRTDVECRWVVIALPNGRFAPLVVLNNSVPGGPGMFLGERNVCLVN